MAVAPGVEVVEGIAQRRRQVRRAALVGIPVAITVIWFAYVAASDQWWRVADNWRSTLTMIFGSFVAGSTPQGGGAVAFPVFTKVLGTPADVARTFSLSIQAVGMVTASIAILLSGKRIQRRSVLYGGAAGAVGFMAGLFVLGNPDTLFWSSRLPEPYVKVTFTLVIAALAYIVYIALQENDCGMPMLDIWNRRMWVGLVSAAFVGGLTSSLLGSGTDVFVFLFIVIVAGLHPRVGVPTSVLAMAMTSALGFIVLGFIDGQLDIMIESGRVVSVGGTTVPGLAPQQFDVFGMWLAAIPIVAWGAPLGTVFVHMLTEKRLILFLACMAGLEVVSTAIFLTDLWTNPALLAYAVVGIIGALVLVNWLHRNRDGLLKEAAPTEEHQAAAKAAAALETATG